ncbi:hypothetical protein NDU88_004897, partial [Pleurodeles waltl]
VGLQPGTQFMDSGTVKTVGQDNVAFFHCRQVHQRSVHGRIHPSPRPTQRTVPRKDNMEHTV